MIRKFKEGDKVRLNPNSNWTAIHLCHEDLGCGLEIFTSPCNVIEEEADTYEGDDKDYENCYYVYIEEAEESWVIPESFLRR